jgi:hypothetical protein
MLYALMVYKARPDYNVGDYIQSLAAARYLPRIDKYINREKLSAYAGEEVKLIMNGWFMHHPENWPPSPQIHPLLTSFHINSEAKQAMLTKEGIDWLAKHSPVGCRDLYTLETIQELGIPAYHSNCLTLTLNNQWNYRTNDIYFVDVLWQVPDWNSIFSSPRSLATTVVKGNLMRGSARDRLMRMIFDTELLRTAKTLHHYHPARHTETERFEMANCFLEKFATAKLVVTSRLHCALPCLAYGTPVLFVDGGFERSEDHCRLSGVTSLFNTISIANDGRITANFNWNGKPISSEFDLPNPTTYQQFVPVLQQACTSFINNTAVQQ